MMKQFLICLAILAWIASVPISRAAGQGDEVVVIYNSRVPESKGVAEHYAKMRQVPAGQVLSFDLPEGEQISRSDFREHLQKPLLKALENKGLIQFDVEIFPATDTQPRRVIRKITKASVRYIVPCYGVPLIINNDPTLIEEGAEKLADGVRRSEAAVDSELACLPVLDHIMLQGPWTNPAFNATNTALLNPTNGIFLVARLDGPTAAIARNLVDKAMQAETNGLCGRAYFDSRGLTNGPLKMGDDWIRDSAEICRRGGFETYLDTNGGTFSETFPLSQVALYAGWYDEHVSGPFTRPTVEFMPGAFAYHLHSFSAATLRSTKHQWVGPLLDRGVTATMGCVAEPFLAGTPTISIFFAKFIMFGYSFGEAACASQNFLSWQTTVVGDPLYRPFGRNPDQIEKDLEQRHNKLVEWFYLRKINLSLVRGVPVDSVANILEGFEPRRQSAVLEEKLAQICMEEGKPNSSVHSLQDALKLDPTPQQRVRVMLTLAPQLIALGQDKDAYAVYQQFLKECPDYPDQATIHKRITELAEKLGLKDDAAKSERDITPSNSPRNPLEKNQPLRKGI